MQTTTQTTSRSGEVKAEYKLTAPQKKSLLSFIEHIITLGINDSKTTGSESTEALENNSQASEMARKTADVAEKVLSKHEGNLALILNGLDLGEEEKSTALKTEVSASNNQVDSKQDQLSSEVSDQLGLLKLKQKDFTAVQSSIASTIKTESKQAFGEQAKPLNHQDLASGELSAAKLANKMVELKKPPAAKSSEKAETQVEDAEVVSETQETTAEVQVEARRFLADKLTFGDTKEITEYISNNPKLAMTDQELVSKAKEENLGDAAAAQINSLMESKELSLVEAYKSLSIQDQRDLLPTMSGIAQAAQIQTTVSKAAANSIKANSDLNDKINSIQLETKDSGKITLGEVPEDKSISLKDPQEMITINDNYEKYLSQRKAILNEKNTKDPTNTANLAKLNSLDESFNQQLIKDLEAGKISVKSIKTFQKALREGNKKEIREKSGANANIDLSNGKTLGMMVAGLVLGTLALKTFGKFVPSLLGMAGKVSDIKDTANGLKTMAKTTGLMS